MNVLCSSCSLPLDHVTPSRRRLTRKKVLDLILSDGGEDSGRFVQRLLVTCKHRSRPLHRLGDTLV